MATVSVDELAGDDFPPQRVGQYQRVEPKHELVIWGNFIGGNKPYRNELHRLSPTFGRNSLQSVKTRFRLSCVHEDICRQAPFCCFQRRLLDRNRTFGFRDCGEKAFNPFGAMRRYLPFSPFRIGISCRGFAVLFCPEPALHRALEIRFEQIGRDCHSNRLPFEKEAKT